MKNKETIYLVDGSGYIFRAYYAIRGLMSKEGVPTNAVFGFTKMLLKLLKEKQPQHIAIAFDTKEKNFRHKIYPDYKANRPPPPQDLIPQFDLIHQVVDGLNICKLVKNGYEADDLIGTVAARAKKWGYKVVIVTADKDFMQLVDDDISLLDEMRAVKTGAEIIVDNKGVINKFGVTPDKVIDVLALAGDVSDNVPGVKGIGQKTAASLINEFGSLENLLNNTNVIKQQAKKNKIIAGSDDAKLSKELVTINCSADLNISMDDVATKPPNAKEINDLFTELSFNKLLQDPYLQNLLGADLSKRQNQDENLSKKYKSITEPKQLKELVKDLSKACKIAIDTETDGLDPMLAKLVGISVSCKASCAFYIPLSHDSSVAPKQLPLKDVQKALEPILLDDTKEIIAQNAKFDLKVLLGAGFKPFNIKGDPMLASYLLNADLTKHNLNALSKKYLNHEPITYEQVCGIGKDKISFNQVDLVKATTYAAEDADIALQLNEILYKKLSIDQDLMDLYANLELPLEKVLGKMEMVGVKIDENILKNMSSDFEQSLQNLTEKAYALAGKEFNLSSPKQVGEILFDELKLNPGKKTKTGYSTDSKVLESLAAMHELPQVLLKHRKLSKLKSTYIDALPILINKKTGRIHTSFNQCVTATGRLSSSEPNLQNIPIRTDDGRKIREAFIAQDGNLLISLDYSQVELRLLAHMSKDPIMIQSFVNNEDVHRRTASEITGVPLSEVSAEQRNLAKTINFGLLYGMGANKLAMTLDISRTQAKQYIEKYLSRYPKIAQWQENTLKNAYENGEVRTLFGRRRSLPELKLSNIMLQKRAERIAINTPVQGSAADIIKTAMIQIDQFLSKYHKNSSMLLQVHDELVIESPINDAEIVAKKCKHIMENVLKLRVPMVVEYGIAKNWSLAH